MRKFWFGLTISCVLFLSIVAAQQKPRATSAATIARGKYLVEGIGLCQDCHTPRDEKGEFIKAQWLKGAVIDVKPIGEMTVWADKSANIAGLPGWEKDAAIRFMMTGIGPNGLPPRPPMPDYRFNRADAEAVVAYLRSLAAK
jgi:hypothetical protein